MTFGGVAQLGEHLLCKQGVIGSIPFTSTNYDQTPKAMLMALGVRLYRLSFFNNSKSRIRMVAHALWGA